MKLDDLPFEVDLRLPLSSCTGQLEIELSRDSGEHRHPIDQSPLTLDPSIELCELFFLAVDAGVLSDSRAHASRVSSDRSPIGWRASYRVENLVYPAFGVLLALLAQSCHELDPLRRLRIHSLDPVQVDARTALRRLEAATLRDDLAHEGWSYLGDAPTGRKYTVMLEFSRALSPEEFGDIRERLSLWDELCMVGGFRLDFARLAWSWPLASVVQLLPTIVALEVERDFEGGKVAVDVLNLLASHLRHDGFPLLRVVIA